VRVKAAQEEAERKRLEEEQAKKIKEEKAALEAALKSEKEKWAKLAEEEALRAKAEEQAKLNLAKKEEDRVAVILPQDRSCSGAILLKALDCLIGASYEINTLICRELLCKPQEFLSLTEALIFRPFFEKDNLSGLWI